MATREGDVVLVAEQCVRRYREEKGTFLHFFHYLFKRYRRQQRLAEEQQTVRGGIHLGKDIGQTIRAIRKYMQSKGIATINREQVRRIAAVIQKPNVWFGMPGKPMKKPASFPIRSVMKMAMKQISSCFWLPKTKQTGILLPMMGFIFSWIGWKECTNRFKIETGSDR